MFIQWEITVKGNWEYQPVKIIINLLQLWLKDLKGMKPFLNFEVCLSYYHKIKI